MVGKYFWLVKSNIFLEWYTDFFIEKAILIKLQPWNRSKIITILTNSKTVEVFELNNDNNILAKLKTLKLTCLNLQVETYHNLKQLQIYTSSTYCFKKQSLSEFSP